MKKSLLLLAFLTILFTTNAQDRVITTGVPFLMVSGDARASGMGDIGVATTADAFSQQWNPSKYAFSRYNQGFSMSYTPYLTNLVNDISLSQLTYFNKINNRSAWAGSLRYFGLGAIELRDNAYDSPRIVSPNEIALDGSYSLKLSANFSMAVALRYMRSSLKIGIDNVDATAANTFGVDIAGYYRLQEEAYSRFNGRWRAGFNIQNLGPKISYDNDTNNANFIPANLKIGSGFDFIFDRDNILTVNVELNKLLVPTPQDPDLNKDGVITSAERTENNNNYKKIGWASGVLRSFSDAPNGFSEELKEITYALGSEYLYQDSFAMRMGFFYEDPSKGSRRYFTMGAGLKYTSMKIDLSYLFSTSSVRNPLDNTLRFSLTFNFDDSSVKKRK